MKKLGIIVNPVAGMGGRVGLKGSDGIEILKKARELGAKPESPLRATDALKSVARIKDQIEVYTYPQEMGEDEARAAGFEPIVLGSIKSGETSPEDTMRAAAEMIEKGVDLLIFAGGDGTARNIYSAVGDKIPVLGIPAGVKIHSAVYAVNPHSAGEVAALYLEGSVVNIREAEVMDIDEDAFRAGRVSAKLYGFLKVPEERRMQNVKSGARSETVEAQGIAADIVANMEKDVYYIIGPGTTTRNIMQRMELPFTLLGVDVVKNKELIANDISEKNLYEIVKANKARIVVTAIGGQGHIFGRGNQQVSPRVIRAVGKANIKVVASRDKLVALQARPLLVDTGDPELDNELCGYTRVTMGWEDYTMYKVSN
ncbi:MAG: ATP-NAD kinase family protein [Syntrophomonadaceae bacterium]|nr:ATP-NAD kinase family protein [Syntrophomonadaceae bacterium]MDD4549561.1 ATP-NAD kinase family protein [Syntrophomonadaceae bacterium]